jgi:hypothetical protein
VADQIRVAVCAFQLEVPVGCQPRVEYFRNADPPVTEDQRAWRLLAAMAGIALDANAEEAFFTQRKITIRRRGAEPQPSSTNWSRSSRGLSGSHRLRWRLGCYPLLPRRLTW